MSCLLHIESPSGDVLPLTQLYGNIRLTDFSNVDGVAPRAKMNQQRARRFRSAQEAKEADEKKEEFQKMVAKQNGSKADQDLEEHVVQKTWDSNVITPGTPFMDILAASLRYWIAYKLNTDPAWEKV
jgi:5'-3' exoribonuclease 2